LWRQLCSSLGLTHNDDDDGGDGGGSGGGYAGDGYKFVRDLVKRGAGVSCGTRHERFTISYALLLPGSSENVHHWDNY